MKRSLYIYVALLLVTSVSEASAEILFESGTLGATGVPRSEVVGGSNVSPVVFVGVRFHLDQPVITTQVGGHFVRNIGADESFFGAIVKLDDESDFPASGDLSTPDVVGSTLLSFPEPSDAVFGDLAKPLDPGWYALTFGSGILGATGSGVALANGVDISDPAYIAFQPGPGFGWTNLEGFLSNFRFVVTGDVLPEPASLTIVAIALLCFLLRRRP